MKPTVRTMIIDDEPSCIMCLSEDLRHHSAIELVGTATSYTEAMEKVPVLEPSLLFLDIEMPVKNGLELLEDLRISLPLDVSIVFYTAFDTYMLKALRASAFDYLLKPYLPNELTRLVDRLLKRPAEQQLRLEARLDKLGVGRNKRCAFYTPTGLLLVQEPKILFFAYMPNERRWQLKLTDGSEHPLRPSTTAEQILQVADSFAQISQDTIVNMEYLMSVECKQEKGKGYRCKLYPPFSHLTFFATRCYYAKLKDRLEII